MSPPVGEFTLEVNDAKGMVVGATRYSFIVASCPATYYQRDGKCVQCPPHVTCGAGSSISDWQLDEGYWRSGDESDDVRECRFGARSCPGVRTKRRGRMRTADQDLSGPCALQCAADHFLSWAGDGDCHRCASAKSHWPTIGFVSSVARPRCGVRVRILQVPAAQSDASRAEINAPPSLFARLEKLFLLAKVKIFTLFLVSQVRA